MIRDNKFTLICILVTGIFFFIGYLIGDWINKDNTATTTLTTVTESATTQPPNLCNSFPLPPQCIPDGWTIIGPDGTKYTSGVTHPKK